MSVDAAKKLFEVAGDLDPDEMEIVLEGMGLETDDFEIFLKMGMPEPVITALIAGLVVGRMSLNAEVDEDV